MTSVLRVMDAGYNVSVMDTVDAIKRSAIMSKVRAKNTAPEMIVRRVAHSLGLRFRLHRRDLPGSPDLVFPSRKLVVFVHGCFWHRHEGCRLSSMPKTREEFWTNKFLANVERDRKALERLHELGWKVQTIWQCQTRDLEAVKAMLKEAVPSSFK